MAQEDELLLLRALLRASDYGVLLSDSGRRDLLCNKRFNDLFGMEDGALFQAPPEQVQEFIRARLKDPDQFLGGLEAVYADPALVQEDEVELIFPRHRLLRRYTAPITDDTGRIIGRLWTFLDITRTRRLEEKVRAQAAQLRVQARELAAALRTVSGRLGKVETVLSLTQQQLFESEKLSAVGLLAASVAHDIRNILTPLHIELALADQDEPQARAEALTVMQKQLDRLSLLTHRLLALAKPASTEQAPVDMAALLERLAELLRPQAAGENVAVTVLCPASLPMVCGDSSQIDQVLVNLALNGVQAMRATRGGTLTLSARRSGSGVRVSVADTGLGLTRATRRHLFDPFFTTRPDGAGLGLFSCRRIIAAHGGQIRVWSVPGQGARFSVWLPCEPGIRPGAASRQEELWPARS